MKTPTAPFLKRRVRTFSPVPPGHISVVLLSNSGRVPLAGVKYRIKVSPDCTLSGTTSTAGLISHSPVPQGTYGMEVEGVAGEVLVPAFPREVTDYELPVAGYMLSGEDPEIDDPAIEAWEEEIAICSGEMEEEGWEDCTDE